MRLLFVSHTAGLAGAERAMAETMQGLAAAGHTICLIVPQPGPLQAFVQGYAPQQAVIAQDHWAASGQLTWWQKVKFLRGYWRSGRAIARQAKAWQADVVLTNTAVVPAGAIGAWLARIPHVWYLHEFVREDHGLHWQYGERTSYRFIYRSSAALIVNSQAMAAKLAGLVPADKTQLIYYACGIGWPARADVFTNQPLKLLLVGAIAAGKNQRLALEALVILKSQGLMVPLVLVGNPTPAYAANLQAYAAANGIADQLTMLPFTNDAASAYAAGEILLLTSRAEAFGRVVVEGQKTGLPVIVAAAGAGPELVTDGQTGFLFASGNAASLAGTIAIALADVPRLQAIATQGMHSANQRFNMATHIAATQAMLATLAGKR